MFNQLLPSRIIAVARNNPQLLIRRIQLLVRHPLRLLPQLWKNRQRKVAIQRSYLQWRQLQIAPTGAELTPNPAPLLSVLVPVHNPDPAVLNATLESVLAQTYGHWELCIADDASTLPEVRAILEHSANTDARVRVTYRQAAGHIAAATNSALELAQGDFVVLLDHDDLLAPDALTAIAAVVANEPLVDLVYSDEDKLTPAGEQVAPFFKPAWSPSLLLACNYVTHLAAARRTLVLQVGGLRRETVGSQDHDLFLRLGERARAVAHVPGQLYSWRMVPGSTATGSAAKPYTVAAARRALQDAIDRRQLRATLEPSHLNGLFMLRHQLPPTPRVSLVIMGRGGAWRAALREPGITWCDLTYLPASNQPLPMPQPNDPPTVPAIDDVTGDYLVWLIASEQPQPGAITALLGQGQYEEIGLVGGVTSRQGIILQAGVTIGRHGHPYYAYAGLPQLPQWNFYLNLKDLVHETSAVSLGGSAMRRAVWQEMGGWQPDLPPVLAQVDLALRLQMRAGYAVLVTPLAQFIRRRPLPPLTLPAASAWPWRGYTDPFWNPNLTPDQPAGLPLIATGHPQVRIRYRSQHGAFVTSPPGGTDEPR